MSSQRLVNRPGEESEEAQSTLSQTLSQKVRRIKKQRVSELLSRES